MMLTQKKEQMIDPYLKKTKNRVSYTLLKSWVRFKKKIKGTYNGSLELNPMQEIALELIKNACSNSETELHTFLSTGFPHADRIYVLINKKMEMRIFGNGRTQIITGEEFCDTRFPDSVTETILNLVAKKMESKRRIMEKNIEAKMQKRFQRVLEDLKK